MEGFWRINYFITIYCLFLKVIEISIDSSLYTSNSSVKYFYDIVTFNDNFMLFSYINEWIQIPICSLIVMLKKSERIKSNYIYIAAMFILLIIKIVIWFSGVSGIYK